MYSIKIDLMVATDEQNLLKTPEQTEKEYNSLRNKAFLRLNYLIDQTKKLIDLNLKGETSAQIAQDLTDKLYIEIKGDNKQ